MKNQCDALSKATIYRGAAGPCEQKLGVYQWIGAPYNGLWFCGSHAVQIKQGRSIELWRDRNRAALPSKPPKRHQDTPLKPRARAGGALPWVDLP